MTTKIFVKEIPLAQETLTLIVKGQTPLIEWNNRAFTDLWSVLEQFPILSDSHFIKEFAEISNFLWKGVQFRCIPSIPDYQEQYWERIELEKKQPADLFEYRLTDYKIFDVSVMHEPSLEYGQVTYFVYQVSTGLPYRVVCPFPYPHDSTLVHYQILPIFEESN